MDNGLVVTLLLRVAKWCRCFYLWSLPALSHMWHVCNPKQREGKRGIPRPCPRPCPRSWNLANPRYLISSWLLKAGPLQSLLSSFWPVLSGADVFLLTAFIKLENGCYLPALCSRILFTSLIQILLLLLLLFCIQKKNGRDFKGNSWNHAV